MLAGYSIIFVLALLLVGTTPIGTGSGVHQFDLVHPLFAHVHLVNGRVLTHDELARLAAPPAPSTGHSSSTSTPGPSVGAGVNAGALDGGMGWSPIPAVIHGMGLTPGPSWAWTTREPQVPAGRVEAPPDPPPLGRLLVFST